MDGDCLYISMTRMTLVSWRGENDFCHITRPVWGLGSSGSRTERVSMQVKIVMLCKIRQLSLYKTSASDARTTSCGQQVEEVDHSPPSSVVIRVSWRVRSRLWGRSRGVSRNPQLLDYLTGGQHGLAPALEDTHVDCLSIKNDHEGERRILKVSAFSGKRIATGSRLLESALLFGHRTLHDYHYNARHFGLYHLS